MSGYASTTNGAPTMEATESDTALSELHMWGPFRLEPAVREAFASQNIIKQLEEAPTVGLSCCPQTAPEVLGQQTGGESLGPPKRQWSLEQEEVFRCDRNRHLDVKEFEAVVASPVLAAEACKALGKPDGTPLKVWRSMVWYSFSGDEGLGWHFDRYATVLSGGHQRSLTAYVAVTTVTRRNGMRVLPRASPTEFLAFDPDIYENQELEVPSEVADHAVVPELQPGDFVLFDDLCVHASVPNTDDDTAFPRIAFALRIVTADTQVHMHAFQPGQQCSMLGEFYPLVDLPVPDTSGLEIIVDKGCSVLIPCADSTEGMHDAVSSGLAAVGACSPRIILVGEDLKRMETLATFLRQKSSGVSVITVVHAISGDAQNVSENLRMVLALRSIQSGDLTVMHVKGTPDWLRSLLGNFASCVPPQRSGSVRNFKKQKSTLDSFTYAD